MPAKPAYFHRLGDALEALEQSSEAWLDRRAIEELLGVSTTVAWRILRRFGGRPGPGGALIVPREELLAELKSWSEDSSVRQEIRRRQQVDDYLHRMAQYVRSKNRPIAADDQGARAMLAARFRKLPAGVELSANRLTIDFAGSQDFLTKVGAVVFALQNDFDDIQAFLDRETASNVES